ncbi:hypothetical protein SDC9_181919 [bioreactor metagenome]|uniref:Uncharacterized protein n=1 Tax=bioreactor metagenome TaxID=1076179 RepID=A0A645H7F2_9ZZZZ
MAHLREIIASFPKLLPVLSYQDKMELVRAVLEKVVVAPDENKDLQVHLFLKGANTPDSGQNGHETGAMCQPDAGSVFYHWLIDTPLISKKAHKWLIRMISEYLYTAPDCFKTSNLPQYSDKALRERSGSMGAQKI